MQRSRSRFPERVPSSSYWGGSSSREPESEDKKELLDVLEKFRNLRPYLNKRLKAIVSAGRERELAETVDDIKYYLNVMNDLIANEHHGIDTILGFIENVHEMIRRDPVPQKDMRQESIEDEDDYVNQPRSPSPSPGSPSPFDSNIQSMQPRRIPVERERSDSLNLFQDKDSRNMSSDVWNTSANNLSFAYSRRSDVDMRKLHDIRVPPSDTFRSGVRGMGQHRRPSDDSLSSHDNYGRMSQGRDDMYRENNSDIDRRFDRRDRESEFDQYRRDRSSDQPRFRDNVNYRERGWEGNHSGADPAFERRGDRSRERHGSDQWSSDRDRERNNWYPERNYERDGPFERDSDHRKLDHPTHVPQDRDLREPLDESLFERRPKVKPEPTANNSNDNMIHYNYNQGPGSKDPSPIRRPDIDLRDKDMRSPAFPSSAPGVSSSSHAQTSVSNSPIPLMGNIDPNLGPNVPPHLPGLSPSNISNMSNAFQPPINMNIPLANQNLTPAQIQVMMQEMAAMIHNLTQQQQQGGINQQQQGGINQQQQGGINQQQGGINQQQQQGSINQQQQGGINQQQQGGINQQQQQNMPPQLMNPLLLNSPNLTSPGANSPNMNLQNVNNLNMNQNMGNKNVNHPNTNNNMGMGYNSPQPNRYGGLLPTPPMTSDFRFQNPTNSRMFRPPTQEMHSPGAINNFNSRPNINANHSNMISQIRQKAQHHFSNRAIRPAFGRREGPNFQNGPHGQPPPHNQNQVNQSFPPRNPAPVSTPPPTKPSILATNQMLADPPTTLDPRLNRANRTSQVKESQTRENQPQSEPPPKPIETSINKRRDDTPKEKIVETKSVVDKKESAAATISPPKKVNKVNKLSEFRKELEKEGMIKLGDKASKNKKPSFEDALLLAPVKISSTPLKSTKKSFKIKNEEVKEEEDNVESGSQKKTTTDKDNKTKAQTRSSKPRNSKEKLNRSPSEGSSSSAVTRLSSKSSKESKSKGNDKSTNEATSTSKATTSKLNFKIPKIKKPVPVVEEVTIEAPTSSSPKPSDSQPEEECDKDCRQPADSNTENEVASSTTSVSADDTEDLIRTFILKSISSTEVERLNTNPEVYNEIAKKLQEHLKKIVTDDKDDKPSSSTGDMNSSTNNDNSGPTTEKETVDSKPAGSPPTKKRYSKRRSDLEKLHDALKEMRFDSMLPLGPRRCTNKAAVEEATVEASTSNNESPTSKGDDNKQLDGGSKVRNSVDAIIEAQISLGTKPEGVKKKGKAAKKVMTPKKSTIKKTVVAKKGNTAKVVVSAPKVISKKKVAVKTPVSKNDKPVSEVAPKVTKTKRGRKRKVDEPSTNGAEESAATNIPEKEVDNSNQAPRRYLTRSQAKKSEPPKSVESEEAEEQPRPSKTDWEKWNKKLALAQAQRKKKQEEKNKKFVATFNASKIKLKLKKQLNLKRKIEKGGPLAKQPRKKIGTVIGSSIIVNSGLGKIKLEADNVAGENLKPESDLNTSDIHENAELNHLIFDVRSVVSSVVNTTVTEPPNVSSLNKDDTLNDSLEPQNKADSNSEEIVSPEKDSTQNSAPNEAENLAAVEISKSKLVGKSISTEVEDATGGSTISDGIMTRRGRKRKIRSDVFMCTLCSFSGKKIVAHYVNVHQDCSIPEACIHQEVFDKLVEQNQSTSPQLFEISYKDEDDDKPWPCLYCNEKHDDVRLYFEHLTTHTGEFMYSCGVCNTRHPYLKTMINHMKSHKLKEATGEVAKNIIPLYEPTVQSGDSELYAYMCHDCHYFQLLTESISRHLETENHSASEAICIKFHGPEIKPETDVKKETFDRSVFLGTDEQIPTETLREMHKKPIELSCTDLQSLQSQFLRLECVQKFYSDSDTQMDTSLDDSEAGCPNFGESPVQIDKQCKEMMEWVLGIVEAKVDPEVSFNITLPSDGSHLSSVSIEKNFDCISNTEMVYSASESSDDELENDKLEMYLANQKELTESDPKLLLRKHKVPVVSQPQYNVIVKVKHNKGRISDSDWPVLQKYQNNTVQVSRAGDGSEHTVLMHGFIPREYATLDFPPPLALYEIEKLRLGVLGHDRLAVKIVESYQQMLTPEKLKHLFKCMGKSCSYTGDKEEEFFQHIVSHGMMAENAGEYIEQNWIGCAYCSLQYKRAQDLCNHIVHQHCKSLFQCGHCFFRAFHRGSVEYHYGQNHPNETPRTLHCNSVTTSNYIESPLFKAAAYRCTREYCPERARSFHFRDDFLEHLPGCVPPGSPYCCHICYGQYKDHRHLVAHYKKHSIFRYQCFYCSFGCEETDDIRNHLHCIHPNLSGKHFDRRTSDYKNKSMSLDQNQISSHSRQCEEENEQLNNSTISEVKDSNDQPLSIKDVEATEPEEKEGRVTNLEGTSLYQCANIKCDFVATNATVYKDHVPVCNYLPEDKLISCFHCPKKVKSVFSLMEHIKIHGKQRQSCSLCPFKCCVNSELTKHFKNVHKVANYRVVKSQEDADDPEATIYPKETASKLVPPNILQENFMLLSNKARFLPIDIDKVPINSIFGSFVGCGLCSFTTKVRTNMLRHLKLHLQSDSDGGKTIVPKTAPVNPVPCLERNELMFDKMTNWAGSSHENKQGGGVTKEDAARLPQFVKEQFRYECSLPNCQQITVDDSMLRAHMKALHSEADFYRCPHCHKDDKSGADSRNTVPIDKIGNHLKLHGPKLFRCGHCDYIHTQSRVMERHVAEKHVEKKPIHYLIRNFDNDGNSANRRISVEETPKFSSESWRCTLCAYKTQFSSWEEAKSHCTKHHNVTGQFSCSACSYSSDYVFEITSHVTENKCENASVAAEKGRVLITFCRNEALASLETKEESSSTAIWKRTTPGIKHIRGIFLEEGKEPSQVSKSDSSPSKFAPNVMKSPTKTQGNGSGKSISSPAKTPQKVNQKANGSSNNSGKVLPSKTPTPEVKPLVCPKCNKYRTKSTNDLVIHLHNEFNYRRFKCMLCDYKFITESSLKGHIVGDHQVSYNYSLCELLPTDQSVEDYVTKCIEEQKDATNVNKEEAPSVQEERIKCKHCNMIFASHHNYRIHILAKHVAANRFTCKYCPQTFWNEGIAKQHHFRSNHSSLPFAVVRNEELEAKLTPEFWLKEYGIPISKSLKYTAAGNTILHCDQCIFKTYNAVKLQKHKDEVHKVVPKEEPMIFEDNYSPATPEIIDLTSTSSGSSTLNSADVPAAKKSRLGKPNVYKCLHCKKNFFTAKGIRQHWLKYHSGNPKGLECSYYEFKDFSDSIQVLPGINLECAYCSHLEISITGMRNHNALRHADKHFRIKRRELTESTILVCEACDFQAKTFTQIKKHSLLKHPGRLPLCAKFELTPVERICCPMGKLLEDKVMYGCAQCRCDYPSPYTFKKHILDRENHVDCDPIMKYNRCVIQENVEIPHDEETEVLIDDEVYKCSTCSYETDDRNVMIQNHLATHIKAFICPLCDHGFEISLDSLFHIRHYHHEARLRPICNKNAYLSFIALRDEVVLSDPHQGSSSTVDPILNKIRFSNNTAL